MFIDFIAATKPLGVSSTKLDVNAAEFIPASRLSAPVSNFQLIDLYELDFHVLLHSVYSVYCYNSCMITCNMTQVFANT